MKALFIGLGLPLICLQAHCFEGELTLQYTRGEHREAHRYRCNKDSIRIDRLDRVIPAAPINLIDRHTNPVTVLTPHPACAAFPPLSGRLRRPCRNGPSGMPAMPPLPAGIGPGPQAGPTPQPGTNGPDFSTLPGGATVARTSPPTGPPTAASASPARPSTAAERLPGPSLPRRTALHWIPTDETTELHGYLLEIPPATPT